MDGRVRVRGPRRPPEPVAEPSHAGRQRPGPGQAGPPGCRATLPHGAPPPAHSASLPLGEFSPDPGLGRLGQPGDTRAGDGGTIRCGRSGQGAPRPGRAGLAGRSPGCAGLGPARGPELRLLPAQVPSLPSSSPGVRAALHTPPPPAPREVGVAGPSLRLPGGRAPCTKPLPGGRWARGPRRPRQLFPHEPERISQRRAALSPPHVRRL